jgi:hypothetical protein
MSVKPEEAQKLVVAVIAMVGNCLGVRPANNNALRIAGKERSSGRPPGGNQCQRTGLSLPTALPGT